MSSNGRSLIPRKLLFGNPDRAAVMLSPDGKYLSYLSSVNGVLNVFVGTANNPTTAKPVTHDTGRGVRFYIWAYTSSHILYIQDKNGDENWHVYSVDVNTQQETDLTPIDGIQAQVQQISPEHPNELLIGLNDRVPQLHDIYRVNLRTGERTLVIQNDEGFVGYASDSQFRVRLAMQMLPNGTMNILKRSGDQWELMAEVKHEDSMLTSPAGFDKTGNILYMTDSRGRNTSALYSVNLQTGEQNLIAEDPQADLDGIILHPTEHTVQGVAFNYDRRRWQLIDPALKADFDYLATVADGDININSRTLDDQNWIVVYTMDNGPVRYYAYERNNKQATFLFTNRPALEGQPLSKMYPAVIEARDGLKLVSYYTLPFGSDTQTPGRPDKPLPTVLVVHGGPWHRDSWGYDSFHQWLANRGYAVLSVNFRGSTGFGKDFINAADLQWGRAMHDDLLDAVDWAEREGIAAQGQVAIMGGSYGGYATLAGLTMTPERFVCGVDIVGPSNLITLIESVPPYWEPMIALFRTRMGDNTTEEGLALLKERSPLTYVDNIRRPLLILQGANDPRVKQAESDQIVNAMQSKNIPVIYALYPDEGHGFARPENNLSFTAIAEAFLAAHLEGDYQPIGDDFAGSSITIPAGIEGIPGAAELLGMAETADAVGD